MRRVVIWVGAPIAALGFGIYLWILYGQLMTAFDRQEEFKPTRIYSDVTRVAPPQLRATIEERLKALGYAPQATGADVSFRLHPTDYPTYLIPSNHPMLDKPMAPVTLHFDGTDGKSILQSIELAGREVEDIYLEPELVATLSRSSGGEAKKEIRTYVKWGDIQNPLIWQAIIAIEDQHFMEHMGLDPRGMARAIWVNLRTFSFSQGGSTITQQLVKNLMARHTKNIFRKINELFLTLLLEAKFDKTKILERYLNEVYLGQVGSLEVHGVVEGARHFFGKKLEDLNLGEIALMAGLIRGPAYYSPYRYRERALDRQKLVLKKMVEVGLIAQEEADAALKLPVRLAPPLNASTKAPYFTDFVKAELLRELKERGLSEQDVIHAGFRVYTTLDVQMNNAAQHAVTDGISDLEARLHIQPSERLEGALASVDHSTGYIRALIGGRSYAQSNFNRILNMKRQVGSTFKPIVYLTAFEKGTDPNGIAYGPGYPVEDLAWTLKFDHGRQSWSPRNYEKEYMGWTSMRMALAHSINTVAARLGAEVGIQNVIKMARALGIESELPPVPSLALGVAELSPIELLRVYSTFANHGLQEELTVIRAITLEDGSGYSLFVFNTKKVADPGPIDLLTETLQSVFTDGTAKIATTAYGFTRPAAGKTGTTSHHRDAWFAGYTPQLTTVVWVGMDQTPVPKTGASPLPLGLENLDKKDDEEEKASHVVLTGATSALPIWVSFMKKALSGEPPVEFPASPQITDVTIDRRTGKPASLGCPGLQVVTEKYVRGHEPRGSSCESLWPPSAPITEAN